MGALFAGERQLTLGLRAREASGFQFLNQLGPSIAVVEKRPLEPAEKPVRGADDHIVVAVSVPIRDGDHGTVRRRNLERLGRGELVATKTINELQIATSLDTSVPIRF